MCSFYTIKPSWNFKVFYCVQIWWLLWQTLNICSRSFRWNILQVSNYFPFLFLSMWFFFQHVILYIYMSIIYTYKFYKTCKLLGYFIESSKVGRNWNITHLEINNKCISYIRHLFLNELYFGFFQTFEDSESSKVWKKSKYNSFRNICLIFYIHYIFLIFVMTYIWHFYRSHKSLQIDAFRSQIAHQHYLIMSSMDHKRNAFLIAIQLLVVKKMEYM